MSRKALFIRVISRIRVGIKDIHLDYSKIRVCSHYYTSLANSSARFLEEPTNLKDGEVGVSLIIVPLKCSTAYVMVRKLSSGVQAHYSLYLRAGFSSPSIRGYSSTISLFQCLTCQERCSAKILVSLPKEYKVNEGHSATSRNFLEGLRLVSVTPFYFRFIT